MIIPATVSFPKVTRASSIHLNSLSLSHVFSHIDQVMCFCLHQMHTHFSATGSPHMRSLLQTLVKFSFSDHFCTGSHHHHIMKFSGLKLSSSLMSLQFMVSCCLSISVYVFHFSVVFQGHKMQFFCP